MAAVAPQLALCKNLKIDFNRCARSHNTVGVIWRVAAIVCLVAAAALAAFLFIAQLNAPLMILESILLLGGLTALTYLAFRSLWLAGTDEFEQSKFYQQVHEKKVQLETMGEPEIKAFFAAHRINYPTSNPVIKALQDHVGPAHHFSTAFIPSIALFKELRQVKTAGVDPHIISAKEGLDQLNRAMILQTLDEPTEHISIKLDNRYTDQIPGVGSYDMQGVIKKLHGGEKVDAFLFGEKTKRDPITLDFLLRSTPDEIKRHIFLQRRTALDQPD